MSNKSSAGVPAGYAVDTSYGTNSNDVHGEVRSNHGASFNGSWNAGQGLAKQEVMRATASVAAEGLVWVEGVGETSRAAAVASGLPFQEIGNSLAVSKPNSTEVAQAAPVATPEPASESQAVANKANSEFDAYVAAAPVGQLQQVAEMVAEGDDGALQFVSEQMPSFVGAKADEAFSWMQEIGLPSDDSMSYMLTFDEQREARQAVISGEKHVFHRIANLAIDRANKEASDPALLQELHSEGLEVQDGIVYVDGDPMGSLRDCFLTGILSWHDDE